MRCVSPVEAVDQPVPVEAIDRPLAVHGPLCRPAAKGGPVRDPAAKIGALEVRQHAPVIYQETNGERKIIQGRYKILETEAQSIQNSSVGFEIDDYDKNLTLVIDPVLIYSTYLGGNGGLFGLLFTGDKANSIAVDENGFAYIAGLTHSTDFPLMNPAQAQCVSFNPPPDPRGCAWRVIRQSPMRL